MINSRISVDWSTIKPIAKFSCTPRVQAHTKSEVVHLTPGLPGLGVLFNIHAYALYCIKPSISADWSTNKLFAKFSCTPRLQEIHTKAEVVDLTPGLLGLGVLFNIHA